MSATPRADSETRPFAAHLLPNVSGPTMMDEDPSRWARIKLISRAILVLTYVLFGVLAALVIWQMAVRHAEKTSWAIATAGLACVIAVPLTLFQMNVHLQNYVSPLQRHYIRASDHHRHCTASGEGSG